MEMEDGTEMDQITLILIFAPGVIPLFPDHETFTSLLT